MSRDRAAWWNDVAGRRDALLLDLFRVNAPYADLKRSVLAQEREFLREARTPAEQLHLRRLTAKTLLTESFGRKALAREFLRNLRRIQQLGYGDLRMHVHVTCLFVQALPWLPRQTREAWESLLDMERKVLRLRKSHFLRRESLQAIAHAKHSVGWPLTPDEAACLRNARSPQARL